MLQTEGNKKEKPNNKRVWNDGTTTIQFHQYRYLGVKLSEDLSWDPHIKKVISKSNRVLGFQRRIIWKCPQDIKPQAYVSLVRPHPEYASAVWDTYRKHHIDSLQMIQRKAARFAISTYNREPSDSNKHHEKTNGNR